MRTGLIRLGAWLIATVVVMWSQGVFRKRIGEITVADLVICGILGLLLMIVLERLAKRTYGK